MSDQYDFTWSNPSKPGFTVLPQTKDSTTTTLTMTGRGSQNWGRDLQENLLWILESFASDTPPPNSTTGQLWYDTAHKTLHVYDAALAAQPGGGWVVSSGGGGANSTTAPLNPQPGALWFNPTAGVLSIWDGSDWEQLYPLTDDSAVKVAFVTEYNAMVDTLNILVGAPTGSTLATAYGYNQINNTFAHQTLSSMNNSIWTGMLSALTFICNFLGVDTSGISQYGFIYEAGNTIPIGVVTMLAQYNSTLATLNGLMTGTVRFKPLPSQMESTTPAAGIVTHTTAWQGSISTTLTATFADAHSMAAYFNTGGQFQFSSSMTNPLTGRDFFYQTFLNNIGTVKFSATGSVDTPGNSNSTGFYDLTGAYKLIFSVSAVADSITETYTINAMIVAPNVIQFQIVYSNPGTLYGGVGGSLTSTTSLAMINPNNLQGISYPTVVSTALA